MPCSRTLAWKPAPVRALTALSLLFLTVCVQAESPPPPDQIFSTLTDGTFDRQIKLPNSENVPQGSQQLGEALGKLRGLPFDIGERIRYVITYLGVKAGLAEAVFRTPVKVGQDWAFRVTGEVTNAQWYAWLVSIHDSIESVFMPNAEMHPVRFYINQQEPVSFRQTSVLFFDTAEWVVRQERRRKDEKLKYDEYPLERNAKDALAALYYFRSLVKPGEGSEKEVRIPIFTSEKNWIGIARYIGVETRKIEGHSYDTDVYQLKTQLGHILEQKGDIKLWITRDIRRLPVYVEANVKFGYIKLSLQEWDQGFADSKYKQKFPPIRAK